MWIIPFPQVFQMTCYGFGYFSTNFHCKKKNTTLARTWKFSLKPLNSYSLAGHTLPSCLLATAWQFPKGIIPGTEGNSSIFGVFWWHTLKIIRKGIYTDLVNTGLNSFCKFMYAHLTQRLVNSISIPYICPFCGSVSSRLNTN